MPRKAKLSRDEIVEAALELVKTDGTKINKWKTECK